MDWLHSYYASVNYRFRIFHFQFPDEQILEWKGSSLTLTSRFISYLNARKMIPKGYLYHFVLDKDFRYETQTLESFPVVSEFQNLFLEDLPRVSLKRKIDFGIDLPLYTHPIFYSSLQNVYIRA